MQEFKTKFYVVTTALFIFFVVAGSIFVSSRNSVELSSDNVKEKGTEHDGLRPKEKGTEHDGLRPKEKGTEHDGLRGKKAEPKNDGLRGKEAEQDAPIEQIQSDTFFEKKLFNDKYLLVNSSLTWKAFGEKLNEGEDSFVEAFSKLFNDLTWRGTFFECKPITPSTAETETVEFRLVNTSSFDRIIMDHSSFDEHFANSGSAGAVSFLNIGKTSTLVSPCPKSGLNGAHIKSFMESATPDQRKALLKKVGEVLLQKISGGGDSKIWLSTSGLGIYWLHVRFDTSPKYYKTNEYK